MNNSATSTRAVKYVTIRKTKKGWWLRCCNR